MTTVQQWSGAEVRALRTARRMSLREFAAHLGVSDRMVSKWEAGGFRIRPRPVNQAALDTSLAQAGVDAHARFMELRRTLKATGQEPPVTPARPVVSPPGPPQPEPGVRSPVDGREMVLVEAGPFLRGPSNERITLPAFWMDVHPVTNAAYGLFVARTGHPPPRHWTDGRCPDEYANHPVVFVTWHDAAAYATWAKKALPSSSQWEKAARGPDGATYPWGDNPTPAKCNVRENRVSTTTPVDRYHSGVSPYGVGDLCGNVWEWCSTGVTPGRYELRGSAFTSSFARAAPALSNDADAGMSDDDTGFRCVAPPDMLRVPGDAPTSA